ncbi:Hypothetical predicted protein [Mytilus galloprovincialis]|uniref:Uncharacterized protein n=1 Tax=Mytilus galloprovincialis TaxID=29158 RepID=A0A8B6CBR2_MYTGA|nr:Hypothetical predicted protein [Mytilus galloprovincialis]
MCAVHIFHFIREIIKIGRQLCEVLISLSSHPENQNVPERGKKTKSIAGGRPLDIVGVQKIREQWGIIVPINTREYDDICEDDEHQDEDDNGNSKMITALVESYKKIICLASKETSFICSGNKTQL